jgi:hypothetical protein
VLMVGSGTKPISTETLNPSFDPKRPESQQQLQRHWAQLEDYEGNEGIKGTSEDGWYENKATFGKIKSWDFGQDARRTYVLYKDSD